MSHDDARNGRYFLKWPFVLILGAAILMLVGFSIWQHVPKAHAQDESNSVAKHPPAPRGSSDAGEGGNTSPPILPMPAPDPAQAKVDAKVDEIISVIAQKQMFANAIDEKIQELLQIIDQCEQNIEALTKGIIAEDPGDFGTNIQQTRPRIRQLQKVAAQSRYRVALYAIDRSNLDWRIAQLKKHIIAALRPDPVRLLALHKKLDTGISKILGRVSTDDLCPWINMEQIAALYAQLQPQIQAEERKVINPKADQAAAGGDLDRFENERELREHEDTIVTQWKEQLLSDPAWRGEVY